MDHRKQGWTAAVTTLVCFFVIIVISIAVMFKLHFMILPLIIIALAVASLVSVPPSLTEDTEESSEEPLTGSDDTTETEPDFPTRHQPSVRLPVSGEPGAPINIPSRQSADIRQPPTAAKTVRPPAVYAVRKELSRQRPPPIQPQASTSQIRGAPDIFQTDVKRSEPDRVWDAFDPHLIEIYVRPPPPKISHTVIDMHDLELATLSSLDSSEGDEGGLVSETLVVPDIKSVAAELWGVSSPYLIGVYARPTIPNVSDTTVDVHDMELATLSSLDSCEDYEAGLVSATSVDRDIQRHDEVSVYVEMPPTPTSRLRAELPPSRECDFKFDDGGIELSPLPALFPRDT